MSSRHTACLMPLVLVAAACADGYGPGNEPLPELPDASLSVTLVTGDAQEASAGMEVALPFVVRVTGPNGAAAGVDVTWHVGMGRGTFRPAAVTQTDAGGYARVYFTPLTDGATVGASIPDTIPGPSFRVFPIPFVVYRSADQSIAFYADSTFVIRSSSVFEGSYSRAGSVLKLRMFGGEATATVREGAIAVAYDFGLRIEGFEDSQFLVDETVGVVPGWFETPGPAAPVLDQQLIAVLGNGQQGSPGVELTEPFRVRLVSPSGSLAGVRVVWRVLSGSGSFRPGAVVLTDASGVATVHFTPATAGAAVAVSVPGTTYEPVVRSFPAAPIAVYRTGERTFSFYDNASFSYRLSGGVYAGSFTRGGTSLGLSFDGFSNATGQVVSDSLLIDYDFGMELSDFVDEWFQRDPALPAHPAW